MTPSAFDVIIENHTTYSDLSTDAAGAWDWDWDWDCGDMLIHAFVARQVRIKPRLDLAVVVVVALCHLDARIRAALL